MTQTRSPGYPGMPMSEAIDLAKKIHDVNRTNPIEREAAAKDMGYTGLTGRSAKVLSDLSHFGLIEKAGKGGVRVSRTAVDILYPESPASRAAALRTAANSPRLFEELSAHFPDGAPSENALRSYLMRQGFAGTAIQPALNSYLETYRLVREESATESHGEGQKSDAKSGRPEKQPVRSGSVAGPAVTPPSPEPDKHSRETNLMSGERVIFVDEGTAGDYLKLVAKGDLDSTLLEALEDFTKRWRKRLGLALPKETKADDGQGQA